jgi:hypothetical protein
MHVEKIVSMVYPPNLSYRRSLSPWGLIQFKTQFKIKQCTFVVVQVYTDRYSLGRVPVISAEVSMGTGIVRKRAPGAMRRRSRA